MILKKGGYIHKIVEFICFVIGPTIVASSLINFSVGPYRSHGDAIPYYYYSSGSGNGFALGVFLISLGFFFKSLWVEDKKDN